MGYGSGKLGEVILWYPVKRNISLGITEVSESREKGKLFELILSFGNPAN